MNSLSKFMALITVAIPLVSAFAADGMYWPEPTKPNTEPDPFIQSEQGSRDDIRTLDDDRLPSMIHEEGPLFDKDSLKELPLEDDPLLRTPLDNKSLQNDPLNNVDLYDDDDL